MKKETSFAFIVLAILLVLVAGCAPKPAATTEATTPDEITDADMAEIEQSVDDFSSLEDELDIAELETLEQELAEIDALEIE